MFDDLLSWPVVGALVVVLVVAGSGFTASHPPKAALAQAAFSVAAILLIGKAGWWLMAGTPGVSLASKIVVACAIVGVGAAWWVAALSWARRP